MRMWTLFRNDVVRQYRYGFYAAYAVVIGAYLVVLHAVPDSMQETLLPLIVFSEVTVIGFFFAGVMVMLESNEGTLQSIAVAPLRKWEFLVTRGLSLTLLTLLAVLAVVIGTVGLDVRLPVLVTTVILTSNLFAFLGIAVAGRFTSLDRFVVWGGLLNAALGLPVLAYFGALESLWWWIFPTQGSLQLLGNALEVSSLGMSLSPAAAGAVGALVLWMAAMFVLARQTLLARWQGKVVRGSTRSSKRAGRHLSSPAQKSHASSAIAGWLRLFATDLYNVIRDPLMLFIGSVPLMLALAIRFAFPWADRVLGGYVDLYAYAALVAGFLLILTPLLLGFVVGLLLLDERDEGILTAVAVTPTGKKGFLRYRLLIPVLWSVLLGLVVVGLSGLGSISLPRLVPLAVLAGLEAPLLTLFLAAFAGNKVEGMALAKVGSVVIALAMAALWLPMPWQWAGGIVPQFWPLRLFIDHTTPIALYLGQVAIALLVHLFALWLLARAFIRRTE